MGYEFREEKLTVNDYLALRAKVGWKELSKRQAGLAIDNAIYMVAVYDEANGALVGMGRLIGDGGVICYIQDLIVLPAYRRQGIGGKLVKMLREKAESLAAPDEEMMLCLMSAIGRENFYKNCGFTARPTEHLGPGMIMYLHK